MSEKSALVAAQILWCRREMKTSPMHVIKLTYISHGWMLGLFGEELIDEWVEAWRYGPVVPSVYQSYKFFRGDPITIDPIDTSKLLEEREVKLISHVVRAYKQYSAIHLSAITHRKGAPWHQIYRGGQGENDYIPNPLIRKYYEGLANSAENG